MHVTTSWVFKQSIAKHVKGLILMHTFYLTCFSSKSIITAKVIGLWTSVVFVYNLMAVMRWMFIGWALVNVSLTSFLSDALHGCKTATVGLSFAGTLSFMSAGVWQSDWRWACTFCAGFTWRIWFVILEPVIWLLYLNRKIGPVVLWNPAIPSAFVLMLLFWHLHKCYYLYTLYQSLARSFSNLNEF